MNNWTLAKTPLIIGHRGASVDLPENTLAAFAVADRIETFGLQDLALISSFNPLSVRRARNAFNRSIPVALIRMKGIFKYTYLLSSEQADNPHHSMVDETYMAWAKKRGYRVHAWTVDDPQEASRLASLGIHGIITNNPQFVRQHLN